MATGRDVFWRKSPLAELHWRRWGDDWAVFDVGSGQTHQMDTLTAVTLMFVEAAPTTLERLTLEVSAELRIEDQPGLSSTIATVLERLSVAELIELS